MKKKKRKISNRPMPKTEPKTWKEIEKRFEGLKEKLANIEHQRWSDWHRYCRLMWTPNSVKRWDRQSEIPYIALLEEEKDRDRKEVDRYLPLLKQFLYQAIQDAFEAVKVEREKLAELEHEQWENWTKDLYVKYRDRLIDNLVAEKWSKFWKSYLELTKEEKDKDRIWADKIIAIQEKKVKEFWEK